MKRLLLILALVTAAPAAWAQCVGTNGIDTLMNCPLAQNLQGTDYVFSYQTMQSPNNTRKMTLNQLSAFFGGGAFLPLTGGTLTGPLVLPNDPTQALQAATKQYVDAATNAQTLQVQCGGVDDTAATNAALAAIQTGPHHAVWFHGACRYPGAVNPQTYNIPVAVYGDGSESTSFTFAGSTDGFSFMVNKAGLVCGSFHAAGFSVIRGPTSPVSANTGFHLFTDPSLGARCDGSFSVVDVTVRGSNQFVTQWNKGMVLSGLSPNSITSRVRIYGANTSGSADNGDAGLTLDGPSVNQFGISYIVDPVSIGGYSRGIDITGYVQGVFVSNADILGSYDGIHWDGLGPALPYTTSGITSMGSTVLQFTPGTISVLQSGMFLDGAGIAAYTEVNSVNNGAGTVTISIPTTGAIASGQVINFHNLLLAEELRVSGSTFNNAHRGVYANFSGLGGVVDNEFLRFTDAAAYWAGVEYDEATNFTVRGNNFIGHGPSSGTVENMVKLLSGGKDNNYVATVLSNMGTTINGAGIALLGTTKGTLVDSNTCFTCFGVLVDNSANPTSNIIGIGALNTTANMTFWNNGTLSIPNAVLAGTDTSSAIQINLNAAATDPKELVYLSASLRRWVAGVGQAGDDYGISRYHDDGSFWDVPFNVARATGDAVFLHNVNASAGILTASNVVFVTTSVAGLPACNSGAIDTMRAVNDASSPTYNAIISGGGSSRVKVYCDGSNWRAQ